MSLLLFPHDLTQDMKIIRIMSRLKIRLVSTVTDEVVFAVAQV